MQKILVVFFLSFVITMVGCSGEEEVKNEKVNEGKEVTNDLSQFDISLLNTEGNTVNISPTGKTIYAYFTGVGWQVCIGQLVELHENVAKLPGVKLYAISLDPPEDHSLVKETYKLDQMEFLTDHQGEFGQRFGFLEIEDNKITRYDRGYVGVNPETSGIKVEVDYLVGDNIETVISVMEGL